MHKIYILALFLCGNTISFAQTSHKLLDKYRAMALEYNHDLKAAEKNIAASMELEKSARADQKPKLSAGVDFQYTAHPLELTLDLPAMGDPVTFQGKDLKYGASLTLLQPVYTGGRILETIRLARCQQSLAQSESEVIRTNVCYQTDIQYWNTVARQEIADVMADFRNSVSSLVATIRERVEVGLVDPQDLLMAEVKLNEAEYQWLQATTYFETGLMAFNSLVGLDLHSQTEIDSSIPEIASAEATLSLRRAERPEIRMAQDRVRIAESSLKLTDSQYKPQFYVGIDGSYASPGYNFRSDLDPNYAVYAKVSIPIFEWGKRRHEQRASRHRVGMATDALKQTEDQVSLEIETARLSFMQAQERVRLAGNSLEKANDNERKALERYREGKISVIEVIDAQTYRQTAQINFVQAKAASQGYYSGLIKALNAYVIR